MARFECMPYGRPAPDLLWFRDGVRVHNDHLHKVVLNEEGIHALIFKEMSCGDSGTYRCVARNRGGEDEFSVKLNVLCMYTSLLNFLFFTSSFF